MPFSTLQFAAHERRVRAELRAEKRQLQDCSVDLGLEPTYCSFDYGSEEVA